MLRFSSDLSTMRLGAAAPRLQARSVVRPFRATRQPLLRVNAFKDWFTGLVGGRDNQSKQQPASQAVVQQQAEPAVAASGTATATLPPPAPAAPKVPPKRDFLEARQVSLYQLFDSSDYKFDIPPYQRPYAWGTKQVYELLQDFLRAYDARQEYFLGAIVATRAEDGAHVPYQLIDGQQRLTSLVLLLSLLHHMAGRGGSEGLQARLRRMVYLEADPLEPESTGRYRLRLRDSDDAFFRTNMLDAFLPTTFRLAGLAAEAEAATQVQTQGATAAGAQSWSRGGNGAEGASEGGNGAGEGGGDEAQPLCNETWWRLYENAAFMRQQLEARVAEGLNLQDFTFHVLRNCFVVLMVARDEGASFRIFSSLNGRGMDLSVVDKLKADLLAGDLTPAERSHYADAWAEMESVLGRSAFHRVFDHMRALAAVRDPWVAELPLLEYFTRKVDDPAAVKQILQVALDYGRLLLQLRQASWAPPALAALLQETPAEVDATEAAAAPAAPLTEDDVPEPTEAAEAAVAARADAAASAAAALELPALSQVVAEDVDAAAAAVAPVAEAASGGEAAEAHLERLEAEYRSWVWTQQDPAVGAEAAADDRVVAEAAVAGGVGTEAENAEEAQALPGLPLAALGMEVAEAGGVPTPPQGEQVTVITEVPGAPLLEQDAQQPAPAAVTHEFSEAGSLQALVAEPAAAEAQAPPVHAAAEEAALLAELDFRSRLLNLFSDESPLPPLLEFFYQTDDLRHRVAFMKGAEALQLHLELGGDPAAKAARWGRVSSALLQRPFSSQAVLEALALSPAEKAELRSRLDSKDLAGAVDQRTLRHLLLRCEPPSVVASLTHINSLHVEKMAPQNAPEGSAWRKTRITSSCDPQAPWPDPWFAPSAASVPASVPASALAATSTSQLSITDATVPTLPAESNATAADEAASAVQPHQPAQYDVRYWYDVQRLQWHGKLGNLVLLPAAAASSAASGGAAADWEARVGLWRAAGVGGRLPGFTGPLLHEGGRYGRFKFCHDECRQRHADMLEYLTAVFEL